MKSAGSSSWAARNRLAARRSSGGSSTTCALTAPRPPTLDFGCPGPTALAAPSLALAVATGRGSRADKRTRSVRVAGLNATV